MHCRVATRTSFAAASAAVLGARGGPGTDDAAWLAENGPTWITGDADQAVEQLRRLEAIGVDRVMLQLQQNDDLDLVATLGEIATRVA